MPISTPPNNSYSTTPITTTPGLPPLPPRPGSATGGASEPQPATGRPRGAGDVRGQSRLIRSVQIGKIKEALEHAIASASHSPNIQAQLRAHITDLDKDTSATTTTSSMAVKADNLLHWMGFPQGSPDRVKLQALMNPAETSRPAASGRSLSDIKDRTLELLEHEDNQQFFAASFQTRFNASAEGVNRFHGAVTDLVKSLKQPANEQQLRENVEFAINEVILPQIEFARNVTNPEQRGQIVADLERASGRDCRKQVEDFAAESEKKCDDNGLRFVQGLATDLAALPAPLPTPQATTGTPNTGGSGRPAASSTTAADNMWESLKAFAQALPPATFQALSAEIQGLNDAHNQNNADLVARRASGLLTAAATYPALPATEATAVLNAVDAYHEAEKQTRTMMGVAGASEALQSVKTGTVELLAQLGIIDATQKATVNNTIHLLSDNLKKADTEQSKREATIQAHSFAKAIVDESMETLHDDAKCQSYLDKIENQAERGKAFKGINAFRESFPPG
jgi:hypothetical protein